VTLTDRSPDMLCVSRAVNPDCEHVPRRTAGCAWKWIAVTSAVPRAARREWLEEGGFAPESRVDRWRREIFIGPKERD
jgi:hypothetical protein